MSSSSTTNRRQKRVREETISPHGTSLMKDEQSSSDEDMYNVDQANSAFELNVSFEIHNVAKDDFFSIKHHLMNYLDGQAWLASELADYVSALTDIGSTIRVEDNKEAFGFISVVNLFRASKLASVKQVVGFMLGKITDKTQHDRLATLLDYKPTQGKERNSIGLILNERMINIPPQLIPPLHTSFFEEIEEAYKEETTAGGSSSSSSAKLPYFDFEYYLFMTTVYEESNTAKKSRDSKRTKHMSGEQIYYKKFEDEAYLEESEFAFSYPIVRENKTSARWSLAGQIAERRVIALVHHTKVPKILAKIQSYLDEAMVATTTTTTK
mmetsp:Transcript_1817/g.2603  ORF Transcript_1817/g.2603 Transcript_1817/m.2603 type:complete len:325 (+) Transcript_1817:65-1039(+)